MDAIWYFWLSLLGLFAVLAVLERIISRQRRRLRKTMDDARIWRATRHIRRDLHAYETIGGSGSRVGVDWIDHRRR